MTSPTQDEIAEANRLKEKELKKREELYRAKLAALTQARSVVDSLSQELDAREVVLAEAESKHGTLLQREEEAEIRERDLADRERQLSERASAVAAREEALEAEADQLRKEHERRMFPLAALEQEVYRRESELRSLEADHEGKLRAFQKRVYQEEERERQREKQARELETKAKEALAKADRRERDLDQQTNLLTEKNKALKAGQVELESRDRDLKWRDEQLRLAQTEVHMTKGRLMNWERELDLRNEALEAKGAELSAREEELSMKELTVSDRMARLLAAEKEIEAKQQETSRNLEEAEKMNTTADARAEAARTQRASAEAEAQRATTLRKELETLKSSAAKKDDQATRRKQRLEEKERAVKDWVAELEFREQQLAKREAQYGRDLHAATGGSVSLAALQSAEPGSAGAGAGGAPSAQLTGGIAKMSMVRMQESYLASSPAPTKKTKSGPKAKGPMDISSANPGSDPFAPTKNDRFMRRVEEEATASELDRHVAKVGQNFALCCVKFYSMSDEGVHFVFSMTERDSFKAAFEAEEQWKEDVRFIDSVFSLASGAKPAPLAFSSTVQWSQWYSQARDVALRRKTQLQSVRLSRLSAIVDMFTRKEESESLAQYFPSNHYRILREREAAAAAAGSPSSRGNSPTSGRHSPVGDDGSDDEAAAAASHNEATPKKGKTSPPKSKGQAHVAQAQDDISRVLDTLPPYLRKHYEAPASGEPS